MRRNQQMYNILIHELQFVDPETDNNMHNVDIIQFVMLINKQET
jgi:hypothetical protein